MKYFYTNEFGKITSIVDTGSSDDIPHGAIKLPDNLSQNDAIYFGYDETSKEFLKIDDSEKPSEFHVYHYKQRKWIYQRDAAIAETRNRRDVLLAELDSKLANPLRWASLSDDKKSEFAVYRQALLDVPGQEEFPANVVWPVMPD